MSITARIPDNIAKGASGGPVVQVDINMGDGRESRNIRVSDDGEEWNIGAGIRSAADMKTIIALFRAHVGPAYPFRFRVPDDYTLTAETIGTGDGSTATFQAIQTYTSGDQSIVRTIKALRSDKTLSITVNSVLQTVTTAYVVNYDTGVITFQGGHIPAAGHAIQLTCEFDIYARFVDKKLAAQIESLLYGMVPTIMIKEDLTA